MKAYGGGEVQLHSFVTSTLEMKGQPHVPDALPLGQSASHPTNRRQDGPQSRSEPFGKQKNPLPLLGIELWIIQPVASSLYYAISAHNFINIHTEKQSYTLRDPNKFIRNQSLPLHHSFIVSRCRALCVYGSLTSRKEHM